MISMPRLIGAVVLMLAMAGSTQIARAQDTVAVNADSVRLKLENERVRVLESTLPPGTKEKMHSHPWPYVVHVVKGGTIRTHFPDGKVVDACIGSWHSHIS